MGPKVDVQSVNCYCWKVPRVFGPCRWEFQRADGWRKAPQSGISPAAMQEMVSLRYTGCKRFTAGRSWSFDRNVVSLRPIAIVPATPSTLDGLCGPGQRNGVGSSLKAGERRSTTVDCLRLACCTASQTQQQGELRQRRFSVLIFLRVRQNEALTLLGVLTRDLLYGFARIY